MAFLVIARGDGVVPVSFIIDRRPATRAAVDELGTELALELQFEEGILAAHGFEELLIDRILQIPDSLGPISEDGEEVFRFRVNIVTMSVSLDEADDDGETAEDVETRFNEMIIYLTLDRDITGTSDLREIEQLTLRSLQDKGYVIGYVSVQSFLPLSG